MILMTDMILNVTTALSSSKLKMSAADSLATSHTTLSLIKQDTGLQAWGKSIAFYDDCLDYLVILTALL